MLRIIVYIVMINFIHGQSMDEDLEIPMPKLRRKFFLIQEDCGKVCDTSDDFVKEPGIYFDKIVKDINCEYLFDSPILEDNGKDVAEQQCLNRGGHCKPPKMKYVPKDIIDMFTYHNRIKIKSAYLNDFTWLSEDSLFWSKEIINNLRKEHRSGKMTGLYGIRSVQNITKNLKEHMHDRVSLIWLKLEF